MPNPDVCMPERSVATSGIEGITHLLASIRDGDRSALAKLFPIVYDELRAAAHRRLGPARRQTLNTTALVHEAYLKLAHGAPPAWVDRHHFFAVASRAMRQIIIDYARAQLAQKRQAGMALVPLDVNDVAAASRPEELVALDEALAQLENVSDRLARVVELRFFGGLSVEETAEAMRLSPRTVKREWRKARAFLLASLNR
jgi:RNA polymerase sigma factor (TIGR02999 family)